MIVADSSALIALIDADDQFHESLRLLYESDPGSWILPWAILPEVDYMVSRNLGARASLAFVRDIADDRFSVAWHHPLDLLRARALMEKYAGLGLGLVDAVVMAVSERFNADAIATLDLRQFAAVKLKGAPLLLPRDG